jgi:Protein of unknown function (DUF1488)
MSEESPYKTMAKSGSRILPNLLMSNSYFGSVGTASKNNALASLTIRFSCCTLSQPFPLGARQFRATRVRQWRRKVPLQRADDAYDSSDRFSGVLFPMTDGKSRIVYQVTYAALQDRASADGSGATFDAVETFLKHRRRIEQIASEKYDAGVAERVVTTADLTPPTISFPPGTVPVGGAAPQDISFLSGAGDLGVNTDLD